MPAMRRLLLLLGLLVAAAGCGPSASAPEVTPPVDPALRPGFALYVQYCQDCHWVTPADEPGKAPTLYAVADAADGRVPELDAAAYIRQSIVQPSAYLVPGYPNNMPDNYARRLEPAEIDALVVYLLSLTAE
jgi:mono/diheme cytochrome c family protein